TGLMVFGVGFLIVHELAVPSNPLRGPNAVGVGVGVGVAVQQASNTVALPQAHFSCDATSVNSNQCPSDQYCFRGECQLDTWTPVCGEGASCRECMCEDGLVCDRNRCVQPGDVRQKSAVCDDPRVREALRSLEGSCQKRTTVLSKREDCSPDVWRDIAMTDPEFDEITAVFPNRIALHFPPRQPYASGSWPKGPTREDILRQLERYREPFSSASQIYVIARASPDGDSDRNYNLAKRRADAAQALLGELLAADRRPGVPEPGITVWSLGGERPIDINYFRRSYADISVGDSSEIKKVDRLLSSPEQAIGSDLRWLKSSINRTVLIIPIPCN
ncbi:MAG: hypothetical protein ACPG4T_09035, partial [Nannocystaceae bacterium]